MSLFSQDLFKSEINPFPKTLENCECEIRYILTKGKIARFCNIIILAEIKEIREYSLETLFLQDYTCRVILVYAILILSHIRVFVYFQCCH